MAVPPHRPANRRHPVAALCVALLLLSPAAGLWWSAAGATEETEVEDTDTDTGASQTDTAADAGPSDEVLVEGAQIYSQLCSACHQPGGVGITGQFPPLLGNPNVDDTEYLVATIRNGREGELTVLGQTYNGRMPAFSTLSEADVDAIVAYVQSGFAAPAVAPAAPGTTASPGGELPGFANFSTTVAWLIAAGVAGLVLGPRLLSANDRLHMPWLDAWLKTAVIVVGFIVFTVFVPSWAMQTDTVAGLDRLVQDMIGTGLWLLGMVGGLWALWYAHREDRI